MSRRDVSERMRAGNTLISTDKHNHPNKWTKELRTAVNHKVRLAQWLVNNGEASLGDRIFSQALSEARVK